MSRSRAAVRLFDTAARSAVVLLLLSAAAPALAQSAPPQSGPATGAGGMLEDDFEVDALVVTGAQPRGAVVGDIAPEIEVDAREIRGYGVSNVAELLEALAPQTESARGRGGGMPVVLVNGMRISSFAEIRDLPTEAIVRVQIFPEELALKYGYRADQRVVNFILRPRFRALTTEVSGSAPTDGEPLSGELEMTGVRIRQDDRMQLTAEVTGAQRLLESDRNVVSRTTGGAPFDLIGNVTASPYDSGALADPTLGAVAGAPAGLVGAPTLTQFATTPNVTQTGDYRTLRPLTRGLSMNGLMAKSLGNGVSATLNATLDLTNSQSLLGLSETTLTVPAGNPFSPFSSAVDLQRYASPLTREADTLAGHLGVAVNGAYSGWRWSFTGGADRNESDTVTDRGYDVARLQAALNAGDPTVNPFSSSSLAALERLSSDRARSVSNAANAEMLVNGRLFDLPAGGVNAAFTVGADTTRVDNRSFRSGVTRETELSRTAGHLQGSFDFPIASRRSGVLDGVGDLSVNLNLAADQLSDFGTLTTTGFGANWGPIEGLRLIASFTHEEGAPTIAQLGDPELVTEGVRVFDFTRGETVLINRLSGGNPLLSSDNREVIKFGGSFKPFKSQNFTLRADYVKSRINDVIAAFPTATAEIESAFPERFQRDADGRLISIDSRPVNFARQDQAQLKWGFNFSKSLGPQRPAGPPGAAQAFGPPPEGGGPPPGGGSRAGGGGPGGGGFRGPGGFGGARGRGGNLQFAIFHTVHFRDDILIRNGVPKLDFLNGSAGGQGGGQPQHEIQVQAGASKNGLGLRMTADWQAATRVDGGLTGGDDLRFSDLTTVDLRLFADLGQQPWARGNPWLRGARVSLSLDNVFDQKLKVTTPDGVTPVNYQPDFLDPLGRTVKVSFRKLFF
ncbi:TonB-dependent receptor [Phenylobacterium immobile]|uniref:TonB-dependent receptor n=1 Tax=Phenylobacterium immobile TaxID=21 RepID=UPI000ACD4D9A|nr:TonB-dependent receptor [Phenylobacterium immobile]